MHERELTSTGGPRSGGGRSPAPRPVTRSLVLWSGGLDSTYALLRVLLESGDRVFSHHVSLEGEDPADPMRRRGLLECGAIDALRPKLVARGRAFRHSRSRVETGMMPRGADGPLLVFMAARAALALGLSVFDRILVGVNADRDPGWDPASAACALRRTRMSRAIRAAYGCDEAPLLYLWEPRPTRQEMLGYLGPELVSHTVSCRRPVLGTAGGVAPCGLCTRCREAAAAAPRPEEAVTPDRGAATRRPPPFRHLVASQSRTPEPPDAASASGRPGP